MSSFEAEYKKLNKHQKEAVEALTGPVMVVAGPGTGKTQVLALRIANILKKTDIKADGILCLTFTNSAVDAMRERLVRYIGEAGKQVNIFTFHSFGMQMIGEYYQELGLTTAPKLLDDTDTALLFYEILNNNKWEYLRPRGDAMRYFADLRSFISLMKRERITKEDFIVATEQEIKFLENNEDNIAKRGEHKGELKKEVEQQIQGLKRSLEIAKFIDLYDQTKKEKNVLDYDDVLECLVKIVEISDNALSAIRERYLYVLVDEHQDSSRIQNEFLKKVWGEIETPDIFVVGDDRQLIYGFSGASIDHFEGFKKTFKNAVLIPLVHNYRSTQVILDASHLLLQSVMSDSKLVSQSKEKHPIRLVERDTEEEEILASIADIKTKMKDGLDPNDCAILVPQNRQVRKALEMLHDASLPVSSLQALNLFDQRDAIAFLRVLQTTTSDDPVPFALSFFDEISGIEGVEAHKFIAGENMRKFSLPLLEKSPRLFGAEDQVGKWIQKLLEWRKYSAEHDPKSTIETIGKELFGDKAKTKKLLVGPEIYDTFLMLLEKELEKNADLTLREFVSLLEKLKSYGGNIPLVSLPKRGIKVLTMHSSKGLEFDYVWIAHLDERSLNSGKKFGFTLPESIKAKVEERDLDAIKRKLYVAITRAKRFCTLSYSIKSMKGSDKILAKVIQDLPPEIFARGKTTKKAEITPPKIKNINLSAIQKLVKEKYATRYVSASLLNNFFECPWKWYFRNFLQLPEQTNENLEFGILVHSAIDQILKLNHKPSPKELEDQIPEPEVRKVVSRWVENRLGEILKDRMNEQSISVRDEKLPHLNIYGRIDLIEKLSAKKLRVTDFKTGSMKKKSEIEKGDSEGRPGNLLRQLSMYSYLLETSPKWRGVSVSESRLEFLEAKDVKKSIYSRLITKENIDFLIKDIQDYDKLVKEGGWMDRPCNYNSYGKATVCEYCKIKKF